MWGRINVLEYKRLEQDAKNTGGGGSPKAGGSFLIKTKKENRLFLECNISTDSFGGNISCWGKNSIKLCVQGERIGARGFKEK